MDATCVLILAHATYQRILQYRVGPESNRGGARSPSVLRAHARVRWGLAATGRAPAGGPYPPPCCFVCLPGVSRWTNIFTGQHQIVQAFFVCCHQAPLKCIPRACNRIVKSMLMEVADLPRLAMAPAQLCAPLCSGRGSGSSSLRRWTGRGGGPPGGRRRPNPWRPARGAPPQQSRAPMCAATASSAATTTPPARSGRSLTPLPSRTVQLVCGPTSSDRVGRAYRYACPPLRDCVAPSWHPLLTSPLS